MLGISIYPEHQSLEDIIKYIKISKEKGYKRIFSSLLEINDSNKENLLNKFDEVIKFSRQNGFEFILDVNPSVFEYLGISYDNLEFFANLGCSGIRVDDIISAKTLADMTHNKFGLDIEINCSNSKNVINEILEYEPIKRRLIACHNFYPQKLTGLDFNYFVSTTKEYKINNIRTAAFVSANKEDAIYGPWPINDGICTLEEHRNLPIHAQAKLLFATGLIDDVLIGNSFAPEQELEKLAKTNYDIIELDIEFLDNTTQIEKEITLDFEHFRRGDITPYMIRSTFSRVAYEKETIPEHDNLESLKFGDVIVCNNHLGRYKGELHVILKNIDVDQRKNKIGRVADYDIELLKYVTPWKRFSFKLGN